MTNAEKLITWLKTNEYDASFIEDWKMHPDAVTAALSQYTVGKDERFYPTMTFTLPLRNNTNAAVDIKEFCKTIEDIKDVQNVKVVSIYIGQRQVRKEEAPQGQEMQTVAWINVMFEEI